MADWHRAAGGQQWISEKYLIEHGYQKNVNTLGVVYYSSADDPENDWIEDTTKPDHWKEVPWHLVENPYVNTTDPGPTQQTQTGQQGREMTATANGGRIAAIYGEVLTGGDVFYERLSGGTYYTADGLGHGEMESVLHLYAPYLGFQKYDFPTSGGFWAWGFQNGSTSQTASPIMATARGLALGSTPLHPALAYVATQWVFDAAGMPNVPDRKYQVRGRKCYDPRLDATLIATGVPVLNSTTVVWTRNDALILADYLANDWFGLGLGYDGIDWSSVTVAANYCDVVVSTTSVTDVVVTNGGLYAPGVIPTVTFPAPPSGVTATGTVVMQKTDATGGFYYVAAVSVTNPGSGYLAAPVPVISASGGSPAAATSVLGEPRHRMDIVLRRATTHKNNIDTLRQHFRCSFTERQGRIAFVIDQAQASVFTFTKDNARAIQGNSKGTSKIPTAGVLTFTNTKKDWTQDKNYVFTDNAQKGVDEYRQAEWVLEGVTRANEAARNNAYLLGKQRANLGHQLELITTDGLRLEQGDRVTVMFDVLAMPGGVDFLIESIKDNGNGRYLCQVSYYNAGIYADTVGVVESVISLGKDNPFADLAAPTGLTFDFNGSRLVVNWAPVISPQYGGTLFQYQIEGGVVVNYGVVGDGPVMLGPFGKTAVNVTVFLQTVNVLTQHPGPGILTGSHLSGVSDGVARLLTVISNQQSVSYDGTGAIAPASQTTTFTALRQNVTGVVQWTMTRADGTVIDPSLYLSSTTGDVVTMTAANFDVARGATNGVIVTASASEPI